MSPTELLLHLVVKIRNCNDIEQRSIGARITLPHAQGGGAEDKTENIQGIVTELPNWVSLKIPALYRGKLYEKKILQTKVKCKCRQRVYDTQKHF